MEECKKLYDELIENIKKYHPATDFINYYYINFFT